MTSDSSSPSKKRPRILVVTPEITYLPEGMGNLSQRMSAKAGGMADVSASLVSALFELGADVHVALERDRVARPDSPRRRLVRTDRSPADALHQRWLRAVDRARAWDD